MIEGMTVVEPPAVMFGAANSVWHKLVETIVNWPRSKAHPAYLDVTMEEYNLLNSGGFINAEGKVNCLLCKVEARVSEQVPATTKVTKTRKAS
jgi:hypothetical protein